MKLGENMKGNSTLNKNICLVGRRKELEMAEAMVRDVSGTNRNTLLVCGEAGVGKTFFIETLLKRFDDDSDCLQLHAKYMQSEAEPFAAIGEMIEELFHHILLLPRKPYRDLIGRIKRELGKELGYLCLFSDTAKKIFHENRTFDSIDYSKNKYKIRKAIKSFFICASDAFGRLFLFVDDLQWADAETLDLIAHLAKKPNEKWILILSSRKGIEKIEKLALHIQLDFLGEEEIRLMLETHFGNEIRHLAYVTRYIYGITMGNPFYITKAIQMLNQEAVLICAEGETSCRMDLNRLNLIETPENIEQIMRNNVKSLSEEELLFLQYLSCCKGRVNLKKLNALLPFQRTKIEAIVYSLIQKSFIVRRESENSFNFVHDIILEYVYRMIEKRQVASFHYAIAQYDFVQDGCCENLMGFTSHLIQTNYLEWAVEEREAWLPLLIKAIRLSIQTANYRHASLVCEACNELMNSFSFKNQEELRVTVRLSLMICQVQLDDRESAQNSYQELLRTYGQGPERGRIQLSFMQMLAFLGEDQQVLATGIEVLELLGCGYQESDIDQEIKWINRLYDEAFIDRITATEKPMEGETSLPLQVYYQMMPSAQIVSEQHFMYVLLKIAVLSAREGNSQYFNIGYAASSYVFYHIVHNLERGKKLLDAAMDNFQEGINDPMGIRVLSFLLCFVHHWTYPLGETIENLEKTIASSLEMGEIINSEYMMTALMFALFVEGKNLQATRRRMEEKLLLLAEMGLAENQFTQAFITDGLNSHVNFLIHGRSLDAEKFVAPNESEEAFTLVILWTKMQESYLMEKIEEAFMISESVKDKLLRARGHIIYPEVVFYFLLIRLEMHPRLHGQRKEENSKLIHEHLHFLEETCLHSEDNHKVRLRIVQGLYHQVFGDATRSVGLYNEAIARAVQKENFLLAAVGNAIASKSCIEQPMLKGFYQKEALCSYEKWGADFVVATLSVQWACSPRSTLANDTNQSFLQVFNEKASGMNERELIPYFLGSLVEKVQMTYGAIILQEHDELVLVYEKEAGRQTLYLTCPISIQNKSKVDQIVINYVHRTGDRFMRVQKDGELVALCIPIQFFHVLVGVVYVHVKVERVDEATNLIRGILPLILMKCERIKEISLHDVRGNDGHDAILTRREIEILRQVSKGLSNREISRCEYITVGTVKTHLSRIYQKLEVESRVQAISKAAELKIL